MRLSEADKAVVSARSSGLGDMLNQLVHVMWYAENVGRYCIVDWIDAQYYSDGGGVDLFSSYLHSENIFSIADIDRECGGGGVSSVGDGKLDLPVDVVEVVEPSVIEMFATTSIDVEAADVVVRRPVNFFPPARLSDLYNKITIREEIKSYVKSIVLEEEFHIGVHVRHGNGELYSKEEECDLFARYANKLDELVSNFPHAKLFLATDSAVVENWVGLRYGEYVSLKKYLPSDYKAALHHPASTKSEEGVSRVSVFLDALKDMYALSLCDHIVCDSWSSFTRAPLAWGGFYQDLQRIHRIKSPRKPVLSRASK